MAVSKIASERTGFAKDLSHQRSVMLVGRFDYLDQNTVESQLDEVLNLDNVTRSAKDQLCYGLQGRAGTCAGFVAHLLSSSKLARAQQMKASLDDEILKVFEEYKEIEILLILEKLRYMEPEDIGVLWCRMMLPDHAICVAQDDDINRLSGMTFTESLTL